MCDGRSKLRAWSLLLASSRPGHRQDSGIGWEFETSLSGESERSRKSSPAVVAGELPCTAGTNDYWRLIFFAITYGGIQERVRMSARACTAYQPGTGGW